MRETFYLFAGDNYYAAGGWHDYSGRYETLPGAQAAFDAPQAEAKAAQARGDYGPVRDWAHVVVVRELGLPEIVANWCSECGWREGPWTDPACRPPTPEEQAAWEAKQARLLPCGCEPEMPLCAQPGGSCGRCVKHCVCTVVSEAPGWAGRDAAR